MADQFTVKTHQGYFSRVAGSFVGVLIGFLLVPGSVLLVGWNEYRTVHRARGLMEAEKVVEEVKDPMEILPEQNGKLVHLTGLATTDETLIDNDFSISRKALRLARNVEMYQWVEKKETQTREKIGGGKETTTTYKYTRSWSADRERSENFHEPNGHTNPPIQYPSKHYTAQAATVGALKLTSDQVEQIGPWQDLELAAEELLSEVPEAERQRYLVQGAHLFVGAKEPKPDSPAIGDLRIGFRAVDPTKVSLLGQLQVDHLVAYRTSNGEEIASVEDGEKSAAQMFDALRMQNSTLAWILRGVGWVLACVGFGLIAGPIATLASVIPFLGRITGAATFFVAVILGSFVALTAIGLAWVVVRPLWAIGLFAIAGGGLYLLMRRPKPAAPPMATLVE